MTATLATPTASRASATYRTGVKILKYELSGAFRGRWALIYAAFFLLVTDALFRFGGGGGQVVLSLLNIVLILVPLASLVFGTAYLYNTREYVQLMLAQPVSRSALFAGLYGGFTIPLVAGLVIGVGLPFIWHGAALPYAATLGRLLLVGTLLTASATALAFLISVAFQDRVRGIAAALLLWLFLAVVYDGLLLLIAYTFSAYPLEGPMIALGMLNPISLGRVLLLLTLDVAALLGYTGAAFERFFGTLLGSALSLGALLAWCVIPLTLAHRRFVRKDF